MRFLPYRVSLIREPDNPLSIVKASGADEGEVPRSFDIKTVLGAASVLITVVGFRVSTQTSLAEGRTEREAERTARVEAVQKLDERVSNLEARTVGRKEIEAGFAHAAERQTSTEQQVQQLYTLQLSRGPR